MNDIEFQEMFKKHIGIPIDKLRYEIAHIRDRQKVLDGFIEIMPIIGTTILRQEAIHDVLIDSGIVNSAVVEKVMVEKQEESKKIGKKFLKD